MRPLTHAGEGKLEKIMLEQQAEAKCRFNLKSFRFSARETSSVCEQILIQQSPARGIIPLAPQSFRM
jgi:hypothetical protein